MESTRLPATVGTLSSRDRDALLRADRLQSLCAVLAAVPDPRSRHGRRYPLAFLLTCVVAALLCNNNSLDAVAQWCREQRALLGRLFPEQRWLTPSGSLFRNLLPRLDAERVEAQLAQWISQAVAEDEPIALDGKTVHGSGAAGGHALQLLSISTHHSGQTLLQVAVVDKTNEIPVAQAVLPTLPLRDRVCTADALHTHRELCRLIQEEGGHYLLVAKEHEPQLYQALQWYFDEPSPADRTAQTRERRRGRIEQRAIQVTSELTAYLAHWPGIQQQAQLIRTVQRQGTVHDETVYLITSLPHEAAGPERLLALIRGQWSIEMA